MFIAEAVKARGTELPTSTTGTGEWIDLSGMLVPKNDIDELLIDISSDRITDISSVENRLLASHANYGEYKWNFAYRLALDFYSLDTITTDDAETIRQKGEEARRQWINLIKQDAEKEFQMGDVDEQTLADFLGKLCME